VVIVDLPGHGDSSAPADSVSDSDDDVSMSVMLDSLRQVRLLLGDSAYSYTFRRSVVCLSVVCLSGSK